MNFMDIQMAYDDYDEDEPRTAEEMLASVKESLDDLDLRVRKVTENLDDAAAGIRLEIAQSRREMAEVRAVLARLQSRLDNQVMTLALANIASGVGVAALVLGAAHAFS
jgi:predicted  nucleic acid-binding Zn-ribbon protein